jgi:predicted dithiol-disulfide oxidoreductase (DUF899 family)
VSGNHMHDLRFPSETDEYRAARDRLLEAEVELRQMTEAVAEQRRALPRGGVIPNDYVFDEGSVDNDTVSRVRLSDLISPSGSTLSPWPAARSHDSAPTPVVVAGRTFGSCLLLPTA